jgi:hypothetical protein
VEQTEKGVLGYQIAIDDYSVPVKEVDSSVLQPRDEPGAKSNIIKVDLPKSAGVPAGTYRYSTSKPVHDSHLWEMYYVNTVDDDIVIVLLVDHNPMCPAKRTWPLTVSRCYLRR